MILISGVDDLVVDRRGSDRLRPQSPLDNDEGGVVIVRCVGCGRVAELDSNLVVELKLSTGRDKGAGTENMRDALSRAAPGETLRVDILGAWDAGPWRVYCALRGSSGSKIAMSSYE